MALHTRLREQKNDIFSSVFLNVEEENTSVLLRSVALYALTYTEYQYSIRDNYNNRPVELDAVPAYDAWFPCGVTNLDGTIADKRTFNNRRTTNIDKIIKINQVPEGYLPPEVDPIRNRYYVPATPILINANNNAATDISKISFFDEVNSMHNWHTAYARKVNDWRIINTNTTALPQKVNVSSDNTRSIFASIQKTGNCEGAVAQNVGSYDPNKNNHIKVEDFRSLKSHFKDRQNISINYKAQNLRDLYRLECIREPAALLTNAMFLDLATASNNGYYIMGKRISFDSITRYMPMAPEGTVQECRDLWNALIEHSEDNIQYPIYYRYDYAPLPNQEQYSALARRENNLLFYYLIYKSDLLIGSNTVKEAIESATGQGSFTPDAPDNKYYQKTFWIDSINSTIEFQINKPNSESYYVSITSFPLTLLKNLLSEWYFVDLGDDLPNKNIEINLALQ
jgi:hypothetical protein